MRKAFTLAELLMVIATIGIVAALTLPNLKNSTSDREYVSGLKKCVSNLQTALNLAKDKYGNDFAAWTVNDKTAAAQGERIAKRVAEFLIVDYDCGLEKELRCFSKGDVFTLSGATIVGYDNDENLYKIQLNDKTTLGFTGTDTIKVDLDGPRSGFNTIGQDIFTLNIDTDGNITYTPAHSITTTTVSDCISGNGFDCASWVLNYDNTDYVRCSDLSPSKITCN